MDMEAVTPMDERPDLELETDYSVTEFVAALRRLADALEAGDRPVVEVEGERLQVPAYATYSIAYEREDGEEEIEFQISWSDEQADNDEDGEGDAPESERESEDPKV